MNIFTALGRSSNSLKSGTTITVLGSNQGTNGSLIKSSPVTVVTSQIPNSSGSVILHTPKFSASNISGNVTTTNTSNSGKVLSSRFVPVTIPLSQVLIFNEFS